MEWFFSLTDEKKVVKDSALYFLLFVKTCVIAYVYLKNDKFVILSANLLPAIQEKNVYSKPILYRTIENNGNWRRLLVIGLYWNVVRNQNFEEFFFYWGGGGEGAEYWEFPIEKKVVKDMKWMIENQAFALSFVCLYMCPFSAACTLLGPSPLRTSYKSSDIIEST